MADDKKQAEAVVIDERPIFEVTTQHFASGLKTYEKGEKIVWAVPEGWNEAKYGRHFASYGPSITFRPCNPPAEEMLKKHKKLIEEKNKPKPTAMDEMLLEMRKQSQQNQKIMEALVDILARVADALESKKK